MNEQLLRFPNPLERASALAELKRALQTPPLPVPEAALHALHEVACMDTGSSQAVRSLLFWLVGQPDPTGFVGHGGLELRRLDRSLKSAALAVMAWWAGPTKCDRPLLEVLAHLRAQYAPEEHQD